MSLESLILELLEGIDDAATRTSIASTINFLADVYTLGKASMKEIRKDLMEVVTSVYEAKYPDYPPEQIRAMAEEMVNKMLAAIRMKAMARLALRQYRRRIVPGFPGEEEIPTEE